MKGNLIKLFIKKGERVCIKNKNKGKLIIISGPSGVGKGTLVKKLLKDMDNIVVSISATTRKPRKGERDGVHYYFITKDEFINMVNGDAFLEYAQYNSNYYGTPKKEVYEQLNQGKNVILEIDVQGAFRVKDKYDQSLMIFVMPPCKKTLYKRLKNRNTETNIEIENRINRAREEIKLAQKYDHIIINDSLSLAEKKIKNIIDNL